MGKGRKVGQKIQKREEKHRKIASAIANLQPKAVITPTDLARSISIHPDTLRDFLDSYDSLRQIKFNTLRNNEGTIKAIIKTEENQEEGKSIEEKLSSINSKLEEIKNSINKKE